MEFVRRGAAGEWHNVPNKEIAILSINSTEARLRHVSVHLW